MRARRLVDAIILVIILAATATCVSVYTQARAELQGSLIKHTAAGEKVAGLAIKVEKLERDVNQLRTDSRVIELFARQKFGFVRSGDVVIKVSQEETDAASPTAESQTIGPPKERLAQERVGQERVGQERVGQERVGQERVGQERMGQERTAQ